MLFITCQPYNNDNMIEDPINKECFICFENKDMDNKETIKMIDQTKFLKLCKCDGWIHERCLNTWCVKNKKCPICRNIMDKKMNYVITFLNEKYYKGSNLSYIVMLLLKNYRKCYYFLQTLFVSYLFIQVTIVWFTLLYKKKSIYAYDMNDVNNFYNAINLYNRYIEYNDLNNRFIEEYLVDFNNILKLNNTHISY